MSPSQRFAKIVAEFRGEKGVTLPSGETEGKRSFGSSGLRIRGRVFAVLSSDDSFVVKLPRERVDMLVSAGDGERFDPRRNGHTMKEWIVMKVDSRTNWLQLAREAKEYVSKS
ncbi:hypothetical protein J2P12_05230 [Candidatus Bathyarchaeota archaeon]|nr:hypothetical protein [Candidatus Bathyarchaeota archaeon]